LIQEVLDRHTLVYIDISPESRVKVSRGMAAATLVEKGWRSFLVKVRNNAGVTAQLKRKASMQSPSMAALKSL
jgi:hypothetical protein